MILLLTKYYSADEIKQNKMGGQGHVERMEENRDPWRVLARKCEGSIRLGRPGREGENNNRIYLKVGGCWGVHWIDMGEDRPFSIQ
jgi:hypothetical protein